MDAHDSEKEQLRKNLKQAVINSKMLKIGSRQLHSSFKIKPSSFLDFTEEKYKDGVHPFRMGSTIEIINRIGESLQSHCNIHFDARIEETKVEIVNNLIIAEQDLIPYNWDY